MFQAFPVIAALLLPCIILNTNETTNIAGMGMRLVPDVPKFGYVTALADTTHMYIRTTARLLIPWSNNS